MARYARVENGVAVELIDTGDYLITQLFAPAFVETMVQVPDGMKVEIGAPLSEVPQQIKTQEVLQTAVITPAGVVAEQDPRTSDRTWRDASLAATEWRVARHRDEQELGRGTTLKAQQYLELLEYRQALRDWPESRTFPAAVSRPTAPHWLMADAG